MDETRLIEQNAKPTFAPDYVNHTPVEFSLTNMVNEDGERRFAFTFIDHLVVPDVTVGPSGAAQHGARLERRYRTTVVLEEALWDQMVLIAARLKQQS